MTTPGGTQTRVGPIRLLCSEIAVFDNAAFDDATRTHRLLWCALASTYIKYIIKLSGASSKQTHCSGVLPVERAGASAHFCSKI